MRPIGKIIIAKDMEKRHLFIPSRLTNKYKNHTIKELLQILKSLPGGLTDDHPLAYEGAYIHNEIAMRRLESGNFYDDFKEV